MPRGPRAEGGGVFKRAAIQVLREERRLMATAEIARLAIKKRLVTVYGKTPEATMASALYTDVKRKEGTSVFIRPSEGLFGLREWIEQGIPFQDAVAGGRGSKAAMVALMHDEVRAQRRQQRLSHQQHQHEQDDDDEMDEEDEDEDEQENGMMDYATGNLTTIHSAAAGGSGGFYNYNNVPPASAFNAKTGLSRLQDSSQLMATDGSGLMDLLLSAAEEIGKKEEAVVNEDCDEENNQEEEEAIAVEKQKQQECINDDEHNNKEDAHTNKQPQSQHEARLSIPPSSHSLLPPTTIGKPPRPPPLSSCKDFTNKPILATTPPAMATTPHADTENENTTNTKIEVSPPLLKIEQQTPLGAEIVLKDVEETAVKLEGSLGSNHPDVGAAYIDVAMAYLGQCDGLDPAVKGRTEAALFKVKEALHGLVSSNQQQQQQQRDGDRGLRSDNNNELLRNDGSPAATGHEALVDLHRSAIKIYGPSPPAAAALNTTNQQQDEQNTMNDNLEQHAQQQNVDSIPVCTTEDVMNNHIAGAMPAALLA